MREEKNAGHVARAGAGRSSYGFQVVGDSGAGGIGVCFDKKSLTLACNWSE